MESHLLQMRGLKPTSYKLLSGQHQSHLLQMRGLKQYYMYICYLFFGRIFYRCVD